jgi:anti-sigma regulatory factor (Ser/Thr protein kinase)
MATLRHADGLVSGVYGDPTHPVVWFAGDLSMGSCRDIADAMSEVLYEQPGSVVIDLSRTRVVDRVALTVLITVGHHASAWPGTRLALCGADLPTRSALGMLGVARQIPVCRDLGEARRRLNRLAPSPRLRDALLPTPDSVEIARRRGREVCDRWRISEISDSTQSVVTELVANAVAHAGTSIDLSFTLSQQFLHIAVRDRSRTMPVRLTGDESGGYGLLLVDAFAAHWGYGTTPTGKVVWAAIRLPRRRSADAG